MWEISNVVDIKIFVFDWTKNMGLGCCPTDHYTPDICCFQKYNLKQKRLFGFMPFKNTMLFYAQISCHNVSL